MTDPAQLWQTLLVTPWALFAGGLVFGCVLLMLLVVRGLRREVAVAATELAALRAVRAEQDVALARLEERAAQAETLEARNADLSADLIDANEALAATRAQLTTERETHAAKLEGLTTAQAEIERKFGELATRALDANNDRFLKAVSERFTQHKQTADHDLKARQERIETMLKPIHDSLGKFENRVGEIEKAREGAYHAIRQQVTTLAEGQIRLQQETNRLVTALRAPKTRGNWGEFQLRQVVEMAGMIDHVDFHMEQSVTTEEGRLRPDATVNLPGGKRIVIDAKTPLDAYLTAAGMEDGPERAAQMDGHARQLRTQMQGLAKKSYFDVIAGSPDFVVMFIPGEAFYSQALSNDPTLFEDAIRNKVIIATPTTLIALLKSVAYGWQQERMSASAQEAVLLAQELYKRFGILGERLEKLGKSLSNTVRDYNSTIATAESRILPQARKFEGMAIAHRGDSIPDVSPLDVDVREIAAPELRDHDPD
ncbi:DNA recombination protein RmuC [Rubricella aquisinus]|uniref:DNA recombination protein RmuC homolog n=1 Tax=Rubricella aquisinus TaxID=2028108 RepID=A0A840WPW0_9RHOB|nr:DNA recombination protein RmuC [Rubricella aquisinus]MBB5516103.1 DNA recombination protein RmuC [Rubricella aquisinus]